VDHLVAGASSVTLEYKMYGECTLFLSDINLALFTDPIGWGLNYVEARVEPHPFMKDDVQTPVHSIRKKGACTQVQRDRNHASTFAIPPVYRTFG
jgi:hypothetical protein